MGIATTTLLLPQRAAAEPGTTLADAEAAYVAVDFDTAASASRAALQAGNHDPQETLRLYTLLGIASSALGDDAAARAAFRRVIAVEPAATLDKNLSPKIRAPYLEARGELSTHGEPTPLRARLERRQGHLVFVLDDPCTVVATIDVAYRVGPGEKVTRWHLARTLEARRPEALPASVRVEYTLSVRDNYGNALFHGGSDAAPEVLEPVPSAASPPPPQPQQGAERPHPGPYYATAGVLAATGVAASALGVVFNVRREQAAKEWNGSGCEQPGSTRGEQCADVDDRRQSAQQLALGFYAAGGALLLGSVVTLLIAPSAPAESGAHALLPCSPGVGTLGAACRVAF